MLAAVGGEADELAAWIAELWPEIAGAGEVESPTPDKLNAAIKVIAHKRWRAYLRGERQFRGVTEKRAQQARADAWEAEHGEKARQLALEEKASA